MKKPSYLLQKKLTMFSVSKETIDLKDLKNITDLPNFPMIDSEISKSKVKKGAINVKFGKMGTGQIELSKQGNNYNGNGDIIITNHPLLPESFPGGL